MKDLDPVLWEQIASDNSFPFYIEPILSNGHSIPLNPHTLEPHSTFSRHQRPLSGANSPIQRQHSMSPLKTPSEHAPFSSGESSVSHAFTMSRDSITPITESDESSLPNSPMKRSAIANHEPEPKHTRELDVPKNSQAIASNHRFPKAPNELVQMTQTQDTALVCSNRSCQNRRFNQEIDNM